MSVHSRKSFVLHISQAKNVKRKSETIDILLDDWQLVFYFHSILHGIPSVYSLCTATLLELKMLNEFKTEKYQMDGVKCR